MLSPSGSKSVKIATSEGFDDTTSSTTLSKGFPPIFTIFLKPNFLRAKKSFSPSTTTKT